MNNLDSLREWMVACCQYRECDAGHQFHCALDEHERECLIENNGCKVITEEIEKVKPYLIKENESSRKN